MPRRSRPSGRSPSRWSSPASSGAALLAFSLSFDDFIITNLNAGTTTTFPMYVWGVSRRTIPMQINVVGTVMLIISVLIVVGGEVRNRRRMRALAGPKPRAPRLRRGRRRRPRRRRRRQWGAPVRTGEGPHPAETVRSLAADHDQHRDDQHHGSDDVDHRDGPRELPERTVGNVVRGPAFRLVMMKSRTGRRRAAPRPSRGRLTD